MLIHRKIEHSRIIEVKTRKIQIEDRILFPLRFQFFDGESLEKRFSALEVGLQGPGQQALAETARTRQKVLRAFCCQFVNQISLIHIEVSPCAEFFKGLDVDRQFTDSVHTLQYSNFRFRFLQPRTAAVAFRDDRRRKIRTGQKTNDRGENPGRFGSGFCRR